VTDGADSATSSSSGATSLVHALGRSCHETSVDIYLLLV